MVRVEAQRQRAPAAAVGLRQAVVVLVGRRRLVFVSEVVAFAARREALEVARARERHRLQEQGPAPRALLAVAGLVEHDVVRVDEVAGEEEGLGRRARAPERGRGLRGRNGVLRVALERPAGQVADGRPGLRKPVALQRSGEVDAEPGVGLPRPPGRGLVEERGHEAPAPVAVEEPRVVARRVALELGKQRLVEVELARVARRVARAAQVVAHRLGLIPQRRAVVEDARVLEVAPRVERRAARRAGARRRDEVGEGRAGALEAAAVRELGEGEGHGQPVPGQLLVRDDEDDVRRPPPPPPPGPEPVRNVGRSGRGARGDEAAAAHRMRRNRC